MTREGRSAREVLLLAGVLALLATSYALTRTARSLAALAAAPPRHAQPFVGCLPEVRSVELNADGVAVVFGNCLAGIRFVTVNGEGVRWIWGGP